MRCLVPILVACAAATACSGATARPSEAKPAVAEIPAKPPPLPDLARMAATAQEQLHEQHSELTRLAQDPGASPRSVADAYGTFGILLMAAESFDEAESYFLVAQRLAPDDVRWPYYRAHVARIAGNSDKAVSFFERTLEMRPDDVPATIWLANVYLDQGRADEAETLFSRALARQPQLFAARFGLGRAALAKKDYRQAVERLEAALAADGRASIVHYPLALAYRGLGDITQAEAYLRKRGTVDIPLVDPLIGEVADALRSPVVYERRGDRAIARGDFKAAEAAFRRGVELAPDRLPLRQKLATALVLIGNVQAGLAQYQELLQRAPDFAEAHYSLGVIFLSNGRQDLAIERFGAAVRADPTYLQARLQLANALRPTNPKAALREYTEVLELDPRVGEARLGYALALVRLKQDAAARDWLAEATRLFPDRLEFADALARLMAASSDHRVRDGARAQALARELVKRAPSSSSYDVLAMALAESGNYIEAKQQAHEAITAFAREGNTQPSPHMTECLRRYERNQPCRTPWDGDPVWRGP